MADSRVGGEPAAVIGGERHPEPVAGEEIYLELTVKELGDWIAAAADRESYDECHRDWNWQPISDEDMLERVRRIEQETGEQLIFRRGGRPRRSG